MNLSAEQIEGFSKAFLLKNYDDPTPIPEFHKELWELCCLDHRKVAIAAPRGHAKSTAITHAFVLAALMFREKRYVLIISDTEGQAALFLGAINDELINNEELREYFGIRHFIKQSVTDVIWEFKDGGQFRITAHGAGQGIRGRKWGSLRRITLRE